MTNAHVLLILSEPKFSLFLDRSVLTPAGYRVSRLNDWEGIAAFLATQAPDIVVIGEPASGSGYAEKISQLLRLHPFIPFILLVSRTSTVEPAQAMRLGFFDCWQLPVDEADLRRSIQSAVERRRMWLDAAHPDPHSQTSALRSRMEALEALEQVGRTVTSTLDLDTVLNAVVDAAVALTGAEEGSLLLIDETTGEFYMRASRNFKDEFARSFRLPVTNPMLATMVRSGQPYLINTTVPEKIKTAYLVYTLVYMPLRVKDTIIGALSVDHRQTGKTFDELHLMLVSALADYAAVAIENARLYHHSEEERKKLESVLTGINEAVIIVDTDSRLVLINQVARQTFGVEAQAVHGRRVEEVLNHPDMLEFLNESSASGLHPRRVEIALEDGRVLNTQASTIEGVGEVISMHDITHLKKLDQIKSDFVHTVSHDLRSPLTAILGYVELIDRVGPVTDQQRDFIHRVQMSVQNITGLINDLLDLGRIEAGFDVRNEVIQIDSIVSFAVDGLGKRIDQKQQQITLDIAADLPPVLGNPVRLRQVLHNLIANANKFSPEHGRISVTGRAEGGQVILQISDDGPGIPQAEQAFVFDKFYRASNVPADTAGVGLGLAIVKSIVENHQGRIWVDSTPGKGATFTLMLPIFKATL